MKNIIKVFIVFLPWSIRRVLLIFLFKYKLHPSSKIGFSFVFPDYLEMEEDAVIGNFTIAINLEKILIGEKSIIGRNNWITGFPKSEKSKHFNHQEDRRPELIIGKHSSITKNHHIDCTNSIIIGNFVTIAGYNSQLLTHSIDIFESRQNSTPIKIGDFSFVGTNVVILGGSELPAYSVLGAKSLLNKSFTEEWMIYGGMPAKAIKSINKEAKYFFRKEGFVY
jgi:acetyltransferase-like isoleucine patch superfamily enzyme